ncbi:MAG: hypothetical protein VKI42_00745 [Synechococcaceae cyanobacterium]|nr:hypothetical protein [Synechococcaceae cyanobacterium]
MGWRQPIWEEINKPFGSKTTESANGFAHRLAESSDAFASLRSTAHEAVQQGHGKDLEYKPRPESGGNRSEA